MENSRRWLKNQMWDLLLGICLFGACLLCLCFLLAIRDWLDAAGLDEVKNIVGKIAGREGIICGCSAMYYAMAQVINGEMGRVIMPIGAPKPPVKIEATDEEREKLPV